MHLHMGRSIAIAVIGRNEIVDERLQAIVRNTSSH